MPALGDQGRELDYVIPPHLAASVDVGTIVRVPLHGRRVVGWVTALDVEPPTGVVLQPIAAVVSRGPSPAVVDVTAWGAWRWAGRRTALLRSASPVGVVRQLPLPVPASRLTPATPDELVDEALAAGEAVVRVPPAADVAPLLTTIAQRGPTLIVTPAVETAWVVARSLRSAGIPTATVPDGWAAAAGGGVAVVGARAAAWASMPTLAAVVVVDAHDGALVEQRAPSWNAWEVVTERARRHDVPCVLFSACPRLEQLQWGRLIVPSRASERDGWGAIEVHDRRQDDPRSGLLPERLVTLLRSATVARRVLCVLNRKGRARLLVCRTCGAAAVCEHCGGAVETDAVDRLTCVRCHRVRPPVCQRCGSGALKAVRSGVTRLREELEALARQPVAEVTADVTALPDTAVIVGTEAVLHRARSRPGSTAAVVFLDFDAELSAPRYRAAEDALALLALAVRVVGPRSGAGRTIVQTRQPDHPVLDAAVHADPGRLAARELAVRTELRLPPAAALAELSGDEAITAGVAAALATVPGVEAIGPVDGRWLVRAPDHRVLCDALAAVGRPVGAGNAALRIDVDPQRV